MKIIRTLLIATVASAPVGVTSCFYPGEPDAEAESRTYAQVAMDADYPALLLKALELSKERRMWNAPDMGLDPVFYVPCRVLVSYKLAPKPGDYVELAVPAGNGSTRKAKSRLADETRYWFVSGGDHDT